MSDQHPDQQIADEMAAGFRALADLFQNNPKLAGHARYAGFDKIMVSVHDAEPVAVLADFVRAAKSQRLEIGKSGDEKWFNVDLKLGRVGLHVFAAREEVCERVVVGTREITEEVPDPELLAAVPTVTVTRTEEDVKWECKPLLAAESVNA